MKHINTLLLTALLGLSVSLPAAAGPKYHGNLLDRIDRQHERIQDGKESGALTRREARKLKKQQRRIRSLAREFREDGRIDREERRILRRKLDKASKRIYAFKHNDKQRPTYHDDRGYRHDSGGYSYRWNHDSNNWPRYSFIWD